MLVEVLNQAHTVRVLVGCEEVVFGITNVYTPCSSPINRTKLQVVIKNEISRDIWLENGDFNIVCHGQDKFPTVEGSALVGGGDLGTSSI